MIQSKLENTLNGGYAGLYGEVVTEDTYRLRSVQFTPELVVDIGANVGVFSRYARTLFPAAKIIAVEPDPLNAIHFRKFTQDPGITLMEYALGSGQIFHGTTAANGAHETYLSAGLGYPEEMMSKLASAHRGLVPSNVPSLRLTEILNRCWKPGMKTVLKIDCEGAENCIWEHQPSVALLREMDYLAIEVHTYALTGVERPEVLKATKAALDSLKPSHHCEKDGVYFWATKK